MRDLKVRSLGNLSRIARYACLELKAIIGPRYHSLHILYHDPPRSSLSMESPFDVAMSEMELASRDLYNARHGWPTLLLNHPTPMPFHQDRSLTIFRTISRDIKVTTTRKQQEP
jgi:hypothetical protein